MTGVKGQSLFSRLLVIWDNLQGFLVGLVLTSGYAGNGGDRYL